MPLPLIDGTARIVGEPELRFTPNGKPCLELTLAFNERRLNRDTNEWENGDSWWANYAQLWGPKAEAAAEILRDKMTVLVNGKLRTERWEDQSGQKKSRDRLLINDIAPTIQTERAGSGGGQSRQGQPSGDTWGSAPANNSWGNDEPPF